MKKLRPRPSIAPLLFFAAAAPLLFSSCAPARQIRSIQRKDLFSLAYGAAQNQMAFVSQGIENFDIFMREGIFHVLDGTGKKVMKFSSYGELLFFLGDPLTPRAPSAAAGAAAAVFASPSKIAADSAQTVFVADRLSAAAPRVFDARIEANGDRIVRRFDGRGRELPHIGQEGPGGSAFPFIVSLRVLEDESLVVVSVSETLFLVHRFGRQGELISGMKLRREALPLPEGLEASARGKANVRVYANLDSIFPSTAGPPFEVILKIDYYRETVDTASGVISRNDFAGSWIFVIDGSTGRLLRNFSLVAPGREEGTPELLGTRKGLYYLLSEAFPPDARQQEEQKPGLGAFTRLLQLMDGEGKIQARYRLNLPAGVQEIASLHISSGGQLYALLKGEEAFHIVWWDRL